MEVHQYKLLVLAFFLSSISFAQQKTIYGTVADDLGVPLPGVNIVVKNTTNRTQTDFDGNYTITANRGAILVFSYLGFTTQEIAVADSNTISIALAQDAA